MSFPLYMLSVYDIYIIQNIEYILTISNNIILYIFTSCVTLVSSMFFRWTFGDESIMPQMLKPLDPWFFLEKSSGSGHFNDWTGYFSGYFCLKVFVPLFSGCLWACYGLFMRNLYSIDYDGIIDPRNLLHSELEAMAHSQFDDLPQF